MIKAKPLVTEKKAGNAKAPAVTKSITVTKRGRPSTGKAMTNAQRQAKFKALKKQMQAKA